MSRPFCLMSVACQGVQVVRFGDKLSAQHRIQCLTCKQDVVSTEQGFVHKTPSEDNNIDCNRHSIRIYHRRKLVSTLPDVSRWRVNCVGCSTSLRPIWTSRDKACVGNGNSYDAAMMRPASNQAVCLFRICDEHDWKQLSGQLSSFRHESHPNAPVYWCVERSDVLSVYDVSTREIHLETMCERCLMSKRYTPKELARMSGLLSTRITEYNLVNAGTNKHVDDEHPSALNERDRTCPCDVCVKQVDWSLVVNLIELTQGSDDLDDMTTGLSDACESSFSPVQIAWKPHSFVRAAEKQSNGSLSTRSTGCLMELGLVARPERPVRLSHVWSASANSQQAGNRTVQLCLQALTGSSSCVRCGGGKAASSVYCQECQSAFLKTSQHLLEESSVCVRFSPVDDAEAARLRQKYAWFECLQDASNECDVNAEFRCLICDAIKSDAAHASPVCVGCLVRVNSANIAQTIDTKRRACVDALRAEYSSLAPRIDEAKRAVDLASTSSQWEEARDAVARCETDKTRMLRRVDFTIPDELREQMIKVADACEATSLALRYQALSLFLFFDDCFCL